MERHDHLCLPREGVELKSSRAVGDPLIVASYVLVDAVVGC